MTDTSRNHANVWHLTLFEYNQKQEKRTRRQKWRRVFLCYETNLTSIRRNKPASLHHHLVEELEEKSAHSPLQSL
ncbi:hypothetical protein ACFKAC_005077, partial [Vibrio parahaemolyticus]